MHQLRYFFLLANSGMSTTSLGENAWQNGVTVFGGSCLKQSQPSCLSWLSLTVTSESKGNGAIAGLVIGLSLMAHDPCWIEHYWTFQ